MLSSRLVTGVRVGCRLPLRPFASEPPARKQTEIGGGLKEEGYSTDVEGHKPLYATKAIHQRKVVEQRQHSADPEDGYRPTKWQRRFLVWTKLYPSQKDIPEIVANGTMNRMHDRMRVIFIVTAVTGFFTLFFAAERWNHERITRDRAAGVVVTKM